jgi:tRNA dimethylallyltransferase
MLDTGLEKEVRKLVGRGYGFDLPALSALGYLQFRPLLEGRASLGEVAGEIKRATRAFIRRQYTWFRLSDPAIHWYEVGPDLTDAVQSAVNAWFDRCQVV